MKPQFQNRFEKSELGFELLLGGITNNLNLGFSIKPSFRVGLKN